MKKKLQIGKILGIKIDLDFSWFIVFFLVVWSLSTHYLMRLSDWTTGFRLSLAVVTALLFFASILAHELGHSLIAISRGVPVKQITLFIFGGIAQISRDPKRPLDEFLIAVAGPLVSLLISVIFGTLWLAGRFLDIGGLVSFGGWLGGVNLSLALFNMIPGFPLDGGRILRSAIWKFSGDVYRATRISAGIGQGVAVIFILFGLWQSYSGTLFDGIWIASIGWFLYSAARNSVQQISIQTMLQGHTAKEIMMTDCLRISPDMRLDQLVEEIVIPSVRNERQCFPVMVGEQILGLLNLNQIRNMNRDRWVNTTAREVMIPMNQLLTAKPDEDIYQMMELMSAEEADQMLIVENERLLGVVAHNRITNYAQTLSELMI